MAIAMLFCVPAMNILRKYLQDAELTQDEFAARFSPPVSQGLIHQWLNFLDGKGEHATRITPERAVEIEAITGGKIPRHRLCKLFKQPHKTAVGQVAA